MCGGDWNFTPDQWARLTDWQILELYLKPAAERAKKMEEERQGQTGSLTIPVATGATAIPEPLPDDWIPTREQFVMGATSMGVMSKADAERQYDQQLAEHEKRKKGA